MKLSIITVVRNGETTLASCLDSVLCQDDVDVEYILIDGASTDSTMRIISQYEEKLAHVVSEPDEGFYDAINKGMKLATGDVIGILNADDFYPSTDVLKKVIQVFKDSENDACYGDLRYVDSENTNRIIRNWQSGSYNSQNFYHGWMPPHPTFFVRRSVYEKHGLFNLDMGTAADYEIMLRFLLKNKIKAVYIPKVLVHMRTGGMSNATIWNRLKANRMDRKAWRINGLRPYPWTLMAKPLRKIMQWWV